ncbi:hypothetical protein [Microvirga sp. 17 mud 1-3]|uniref:hypothetical protein n=1 Tax=Microvirga sp. 17 mud 1-3 TaxID=2082949 RepID=UPI000D6C0A5B|nr:hypothetical protein [Microvirga sp. 17 mud 1-3]AWM89267.1 hypothetical protein C4E04_19985 [Microvirga sp. 17 mud 1-3]
MVDKTQDEPVHPPRIDAIFRSGSLTAISVVLGFSLGFLSRWGGLPGEWTRSDVFAVIAITLGIVLQIKALIDLLSIESLVRARYERAIRIFVTGLVLVTLGVAAAIFAELIGYGGIALEG